MRLLPGWIHRGLKAIAGAATPLLVRSGISPNMLTLLGFLTGAAAGVLLAVERPLWSLAAGSASAFFDGVDGLVAAAGGRKTRFGAMLDSTLDRYVEFFLFGGLAVHFRGRWPAWLALFALMGAILVSYTRARAEGLGFDGSVGWMQRPERFLLLGLGIVVGQAFGIEDPAWIVVLVLIAFFSHLTAVQRLFQVKKMSGTAGKP